MDGHMDTMELKPRWAWRRQSAEFKAGVIEACRQPGVYQWHWPMA
jgi:hypothetical protein